MRTVLGLSLVGLVLACLPVRGEPLDLGDRSSETLTGKAWKALENGKYADAIGYAKKCVELYEKEALKMQGELKAAVPDGDREAVAKKWALNDVGTCLFIQGQALEKQDKGADAIAAYKRLVDKLPFAQCWDPKGWYWKPATAAKARIKALQFDSEK